MICDELGDDLLLVDRIVAEEAIESWLSSRERDF